jgi:hypothetical protein
MRLLYILISFGLLIFLPTFVLAQKIEMDASLMETIYCDGNVIYKFSGKNEMETLPFVGRIIKNIEFPSDSKEMTIEFDPMVVPDAFYVKYGDQEFFSGFMGDVWNPEYKQVALSMDERKKMLYIQPKSFIDYINFMKDDDFSSTENMSRNFVGELMYYKEKERLTESINGAIGSVGGQLKVDSIFKQGDTQAKKVTDDMKSINIDITKSENRKEFITKFNEKLNSYSGIMKKNNSFTITKKQENIPIIVMIFSPLDRTIFKLQLNCK